MSNNIENHIQFNDDQKILFIHSKPMSAKILDFKESFFFLFFGEKIFKTSLLSNFNVNETTLITPPIVSLTKPHVIQRHKIQNIF